MRGQLSGGPPPGQMDGIIPTQHLMRRFGVFRQMRAVKSGQKAACQLMSVTPQPPDIETFNGRTRRQKRFMPWQQKLAVVDHWPGWLPPGGEPVYQMACGDQHRFLTEQVFNLRPINHKPLFGTDNDVLLQAEIGRAQADGAIAAPRGDNTVNGLQNWYNAGFPGHHGIAAL